MHRIAIGAGEAFYNTLLYSVSKVAMTENVRLSDKTAFLAMKSAYVGNIGQSLRDLKDRIEEIPNKKEALQKMVERYFLVQETHNLTPLVITPLNEDRVFINNLIRERLKETSVLVGTPLEIPVYLSVDRREVDKKEIATYTVNDVIQFNKPDVRLGLKRRDYTIVLDIDVEHHRLHLKNDDNIFYWSPKNLEKPSDITIYRQEAREFLKNDTIVFKKNNEDLGIANGDKAKVLDINGFKMSVILDNHYHQHAITVDLTQKENQHIDYGYALTPYAAQGLDVEYVIAYGEGPKPYPRKTKDLKVGDIIAVPGEYQTRTDLSTEETTKLGEVTNIQGDYLKLNISGHPTEIITNKNTVWEYFPPFEERRQQELPLSSALQSFIVQITRGNGLYLVVPHVRDFERTLRQHARQKQSAFSHLDLNWQRLSEGVNRLVENISGKVENPGLTKSTCDLNGLSKEAGAVQIRTALNSEIKANKKPEISLEK